VLALTFGEILRVCSDVDVPRPRYDEALIRVRTAGICNTDLEITRGYKGFSGILGHEFVGEVVECRADGWAGTRVCGEINISCGACSLCRAGLPSHCERREVLGILHRDGVFAEYVVLPIRNLHKVPETLSDDIAVFIEPVAAAFEVLQQVQIDQSRRVVVLGDGKLGLVCAQVAASAGADVLLLGRHDENLQLAREFGLRAQLADDVDAVTADLVIEATGSSTGLGRALSIVRPRGTIVLKTTSSARTEADLSSIVVNEITVVGSRCGPFPEAIQGLKDGRVQVLPLIAERYALSDSVHAMERAAQPGVLKVLIDMESK
jgi:threonine dehydrogenase-like Zn-dependent dehydrogenase